MLTLDFEKENFKRYSNGRGYRITVDTRNSGRKIYGVFKEKGEYEKYLPDIIIEDIDGIGENDFRIINNIYIDTKAIDDSIDLLEKYLQAYNIAKESIEEFETNIMEDKI